MLLNMFLLVLFVLVISAMPSPQMKLAPGHYSVSTQNGQMAPGSAPPVEQGWTINGRLWIGNIVRYIQMVASGTLGKDQRGHLVSAIVGERLGNSMLLLASALLLALVLGTLKGVSDFRQMRRRRMALGPVLTGAVEGLPDFLLILILQWLGVLTYSWLSKHPAWQEFFGGTPLPVVFAVDKPIRSFLLPLFCLTLIPWSYVARTISQAMQDVWEQDYIRTATAKGLREAVVVYRHALRNAVIPLLDDLPNLMTVTLSNMLVVEYLFAYPGLTILVKDAVNPPISLPSTRSMIGFIAQRPDTPVLVASGVAIGLILSFTYLLITLARYWADPLLKEGDRQ
ncbi:MAG: ABC transporter permease subunit [Mycobacterium leprae]